LLKVILTISVSLGQMDNNTMALFPLSLALLFLCKWFYGA